MHLYVSTSKLFRQQFCPYLKQAKSKYLNSVSCLSHDNVNSLLPSKRILSSASSDAQRNSCFSIWKHDKMALPQNSIPLWQMLLWDMSRGVSADCCLSEAEWCHYQHGLDENQAAVAHFINSSAAVQLRNRCDLVMQAQE